MGGVSRLLSYGSLFSLLMVLSSISQCDAQFRLGLQGTMVTAADIAACRTMCTNMPGCAAFDFTTAPTCTLYQAPIACLKPLIADATATFEVVRLDLCPFMPPGSIPAKFDTQDAGFTIQGGMANSANNITACVAACSTGCFGISFDYSSTASTRCFLLMTMTAVCMTPLVASSTGVVYRVACPVGTGLPAKFGTSMLNMELMGGTTVPQARTLQSCAANCGSSCIAITFDTATLMCRTHFSATGCNAAVTNLNAITVRCATCTTAPGQNTTTCFGNMQTLTCATGIVSIVSATYSRVTGSPVCLPNTGTPTACTEPNIFPIVQSICNNNAGTCNVMNSITSLSAAAALIPIGFAGCTAGSSPVLMIQYNCVTTTPISTIAPSTVTASTLTMPPTFMAQMYTVTTGTHIPNGVQLPGANYTSASSCTTACDSMSTCVAADWNMASNTCFLHGVATGCNALVNKTTCNNYRRVGACTTTTPPSTVTLAQLLANFIPTANMNIMGGVEQTNLTSLMTCAAACNSNPMCFGFDYSNATSGCFFFFGMTECGTLQSAPGVNHYRRITVFCGGTPATTPATTAAPTFPTVTFPSFTLPNIFLPNNPNNIISNLFGIPNLNIPGLNIPGLNIPPATTTTINPFLRFFQNALAPQQQNFASFLPVTGAPPAFQQFPQFQPQFPQFPQFTGGGGAFGFGKRRKRSVEEKHVARETSTLRR